MIIEFIFGIHFMNKNDAIVLMTNSNFEDKNGILKMMKQVIIKGTEM